MSIGATTLIIGGIVAMLVMTVLIIIGLLMVGMRLEKLENKYSEIWQAVEAMQTRM